MARRRAGGFSLGMRQRLGIAAAMLGDPPVLMFDEPFNGMDPEGIVWMRGFLRSLAAEGRAVLVSSHLMSELQDTADHLVVVGRGRVIADTSISELIAATSGDRVTLRTNAWPEAATVLEDAGAAVTPASPDTLTVSGLAAEQIVSLLGAQRRAVLRGVGAPRHAGGGLPGTHPRPGRIPGPGGRGGDPMSAGVMTRSAAGPAPAARAGFGSVLRAEWTKFRTVRGWVIGMIVAAVLIDLIGLLAVRAGIGCGNGRTGAACLQPLPTGPGGEAVTDSFYFVRRPLTSHGSITARITALTGRYVSGGGRGSGPAGRRPAAGNPAVVQGRHHHQGRARGQGSAYAAMMATGGHGVRFQYNYAQDLPGLPGPVSAASPRWLRLTRSGTMITGYDSADGRHWTRLGAARLAGLPATAQAGLFATSPPYMKVTSGFGGSSGQIGPSLATGVFDHVGLSGGQPGGRWTGQDIGAGGPGLLRPADRVPPGRGAVHGDRVR